MLCNSLSHRGEQPSPSTNTQGEPHRPLHTEEAVIGPTRLLVEALLPQLRVLSEGISRFEAEKTIPRFFWAKAFYESHRARSARHQAALGALVFRWIRILHRCWLDRVPYDESRYLMALQKRGAPLLKHAAQNS